MSGASATLPAPVSQMWRGVRRRLPPAAVEAVQNRGRLALERLRVLPALGPDAAECTICGLRTASFEPFGNKQVLPDRRCQRCRSLERHRLLWLFFQRETNLFADRVRMLHFAPESTFSARLSRRRNIDYLTADLDPTSAMVAMDITQVPLPDASVDVVFASHVLEHVPDDRAAMAELHRVLRPDGWAVLQVPMWGATTREDPSVTDPAERARLFGQDDHVRMYGHDGVYRQRLEDAGFAVEVVDYAHHLPTDVVARHRLELGVEDIYRCTPAR